MTLRLLATDPDERYADADTLIDDLKGVLRSLEDVDGTTVEEQPASGDGVAEEPTITTAEDEGSLSVQVPDLAGHNIALASNTLANASLKLGAQNEVPSETMPEGEILGQTPEAGTEVQAGSLVSVTVSSRPSTVEVPDLANLNLSDVSRTLHAVGLKLGDQNEASSDTAPQGEIIGQYPTAHTRVQRESVVSITVSSGPQKVSVPDLTGQTLSRVRTNLANASLKLVVKNETRSETASQGAIVKQEPAAGTRVRKGSAVRVTVSSGPPTVEVPDLAGRNSSEVRSMLRAAGLAMGTLAEAPNDDVPKGGIVEQHPPAGTKAERGSSVHLTVSSGPQKFAVPNITGQRLQQARETLAEVGLHLARLTEVPSDTVIKGKITKQDPPAGTKAKRGSSVSVMISSGPVPVEVPNLTYKSVLAAGRMLAQKGLTLGSQKAVPRDTGLEGLIVDQTPEPGTKVKRGSSVSVTVRTRHAKHG